MKASIPASCGEPYTIRKSGRLYTLIRRSQKHNHRIVMAEEDVITLINTFADLIEQDNKHV